jgi:hypothetical protein
MSIAYQWIDYPNRQNAAYPESDCIPLAIAERQESAYLVYATLSCISLVLPLHSNIDLNTITMQRRNPPRCFFRSLMRCKRVEKTDEAACWFQEIADGA